MFRNVLLLEELFHLFLQNKDNFRQLGRVPISHQQQWSPVAAVNAHVRQVLLVRPYHPIVKNFQHISQRILRHIHEQVKVVRLLLLCPHVITSEFRPRGITEVLLDVLGQLFACSRLVCHGDLTSNTFRSTCGRRRRCSR